MTPLRMLLCCAAIGSLPSIEAREFTDARGRKIEAELVAHAGEHIVIRRGSKEFSVHVTAFSAEDQEYIRNWIGENPGAVRFKFGFFADLEKEAVSQRDAPGGASEDKLKTIPYTYEMIVYNREVAPATDLEIRYEIYVNDYVDVRNNRFVGLAVGKEKVARIQAIAGKIESVDIPANGRHDFERTFDTHFYIDRDGGRTDEAATDKVIGVRARVYRGGKLLEEFVEGEDDDLMAKTPWQDEKPSTGAGPKVGR